MSNYKVGVIGTGSFGLAIAKLMARNRQTLVYGRNAESLDLLRKKKHALSSYLPDLEYTEDYKYLLNSCQLICPAVPSANFLKMLNEIRDHLKPSHFIIHTSKGLYAQEDDPSQVLFISELIEKYSNVLRIGYLSGPNLAKEIMLGMPAAAVIASKYDEVLDIGRDVFDSPDFRIVKSRDIEGAQIAGAFKNIIALGTGMIQGLGWGKNTQGYFLTRGWQELMHIGHELCSVFPHSMLGLAGIGDLFATATSELSRNFSFGLFKASNQKNQDKYDFRGEDLAEGVFTVKIMEDLLRNRGIQSPLISAMYRIIHENQDVLTVVKEYLASDQIVAPDFLQNIKNIS